MHKMRALFVKTKGVYVSEITLKMPLQKKNPQELLLLKTSLCNEDLVKWLGGSFIMLIRGEYIFTTSVPWLLLSEGVR